MTLGHLPLMCQPKMRIAAGVKKYRTLGLLVLLAAAPSCAPWVGWAGPTDLNIAPAPGYDKAAAILSPFIDHELADKKLPAVSIALVEDQHIVWAQGFGYADPEGKVPATAETVYRVGSVSKLFTDIAIMQLVERGELNLDAPVDTYLPDFHPANPFGTPITLRELMSHRSGLLREPPVGSYFDPSPPGLPEVVRSMNRTALVYPPGTHTKYSNIGITAVGYALERKTGQPFAPYLKRAVLDPMGMSGSSFEPDAAVTHSLAKAYMWSYDGRMFAAPTFELGIFPAGCMYTTVTDLGRFMSMLFAQGRAQERQVLKPETLREMWTPQFAKPGEKAAFGIGFVLSELDGHRLIGQDGAIYGFATTLLALPEDRLGVVVVTTKDSSNAVTDHVAHEALKLMLAVKAGRPLGRVALTGPVPSEFARRLAGRYGEGQEAVELTERNGRLFLLPSRGGYEVEIKRLGDDLIVDDRLSYGLKITPRPEAIELDSKLLKRASTRRPADVPEAWRGLIGEYGWDHDVLYVLEKDGHLTTLIEWYEYDPLAQKSRDEFSFPDYGLYDHETATFTRDAKGEATQVRIGGVVFKRRPVGLESGGIFRIRPLKPVDELRREALAARPPAEKGDFLGTDLVELASLDPTIKLDIRYAGANNFLSTPLYTQARAFLQRPAAEALVRASQHLKGLGYGLLIHDAYRPWYVTKMFWDATPEDKRIFVANPSEGSRHNRGCAVDLTLYDLPSGKPVPMVGVYDEMTERSYPDYPGGTSLQRWHRTLLRRALEEQGFTVYDFEWWHFDYKDWRRYPILNMTFEQIGSRQN
jgi:CubicO group peptidase (beta-lactamase class C family)/D-alanyl-D-alanine dipeptidase